MASNPVMLNILTAVQVKKLCIYYNIGKVLSRKLSDNLRPTIYVTRESENSKREYDQALEVTRRMYALLRYALTQ